MLPLSKNCIKNIRQLELRKFRRQTGLFVAEGNKLVEDNLSSMHCKQLIATQDWWATHPNAIKLAEECYEVKRDEMERVSLLQSPQEVMGTFVMPDYPLDKEDLKSRLCFVLDGIQDPGNLGTIIRLSDWFGITDIICSPNTVDCFNPKVVQATMGAIARIKVHYTPLVPFLQEMKDIPVYGTYLEGTNIYTTPLSAHGLIIMGNEGKGISQELEHLVTTKLNIPSFAVGDTSSESLNVGIASAIVISEFRRRM